MATLSPEDAPQGRHSCCLQMTDRPESMAAPAPARPPDLSWGLPTYWCTRPQFLAPSSRSAHLYPSPTPLRCTTLNAPEGKENTGACSPSPPRHSPCHLLAPTPTLEMQPSLLSGPSKRQAFQHNIFLPQNVRIKGSLLVS